MSYNKLHYSSVDLKVLADRVELVSNFICPKCRRYAGGKITAESPRAALKRTMLSATPEKLNFNGRVTFVMPCCGTRISLYVAIHGKDHTISTELIEPDWWTFIETMEV